MIAPRSLHFILTPTFVGAGILLLSLLAIPWVGFLSIPLFLLSLLFGLFFRDPARAIGDGIVSPADGKVIKAKKNFLSIYMCLWDVHVNRAPLAGRVVKIKHTSGKHKPAFAKDVKENERLTLELQTKHGIAKVIQIAGALARRIESYVREGELVKKGERIGMVRFGSRVDLYLPEDVNLKVEVGDKVKAGKQIGVDENL